MDYLRESAWESLPSHPRTHTGWVTDCLSADISHLTPPPPPTHPLTNIAIGNALNYTSQQCGESECGHHISTLRSQVINCLVTRVASRWNFSLVNCVPLKVSFFEITFNLLSMCFTKLFALIFYLLKFRLQQNNNTFRVHIFLSEATVKIVSNTACLLSNYFWRKFGIIFLYALCVSQVVVNLCRAHIFFQSY